MIRVFTSFSGYDSQCLALNRLGIEYDLVGWSEIDKYAIIAHNALFPQFAERNFGDISKIDWNAVPDFDLFTYSSPCQDFSIAGRQRGGEKGSNTRSSLLWECEKAISIKRPKYCLMENVSALVSAKFIKLFNRWQLTLERLGYSNYAKVLNAKDYGVTQNRERIFLISILDGGRYTFPEPQKLTKRLKDLLENNVDERFYLKQSTLEGYITAHNKAEKDGTGYKFNPTAGDTTEAAITTHCGNRITDNYIMENTDRDGNARTITSHYGKQGWSKLLHPNMDKDNYIKEHKALKVMPNGNIRAYKPDTEKQDSCGELQITNPENVAPTVITAHVPKILESNNKRLNHLLDTKEISQTEPMFLNCYNDTVKENETGTILTNVDKSHLYFITEPKCQVIGQLAGEQLHNSTRRVFGTDGISPTLCAVCNDALTKIQTPNFRVRKLTPRECFRLMGVGETEIDTLLNSGLSNSRLYVLAGNSIVVDVLVALFDRLLIHNNIHKTLF